MELLLLVFFCLLTGSEVTFGAENEKKVIIVEEGSDVTLPCLLREDITNKKFEWKKDGRQVFLYDDGDHSNNVRSTGQDQQFKGRVEHLPDKLKSGDASITIRDSRAADSGLYTCEFPDLQPSQIFHIQLFVGTTIITVDEGRDVMLPCSLREDITKKKFVWKKDGRQVFLYDAGDHSNNAGTGQDQLFKDRVSHFPDKLKSGDASITISNMKVAETGNYTCEFPDLQPRQIFYVQLIVYVTSPQPSVMTLEQRGKSAVLQCKVKGAFPKPELHWEDSEGHKLPAEKPQESERGGLYDIILKTTVTKTGNYRCVATQKEINHQTDSETYVFVPVLTDGQIAGIVISVLLLVALALAVYRWRYHIMSCLMKVEAPQPSVRILEQTDESAVLQCEVQGAFPKPEFHWENGAGNKLPAEKPEVRKRGLLYDIILQTIVIKTDYYRCVVTQKEINYQTHDDIHVYIPVKVPKPSVRILEQSSKSAVLQCEVQGAFPKPELHWEDGAGNKLPAEEPEVRKRGGLYDVILRTAVTKTDYYRCVATQKEINYQTHAYQDVRFTETTFIRVDEGRDVILPCLLRQNITKEKFVWKKDGQVFPYDAGDHSNIANTDQDRKFIQRFKHLKDQQNAGNASLIIRSTKAADSGDYTCEFPEQPEQIFHIKLDVEPKVFRVKEGSKATLPCSLYPEDITNKKFEWKKDGRQVFLYDTDTVNDNSQTQHQQFKDRVEHFPKQLKLGQATITISNTKVDDSGLYKCEFPDLQPSEIFYMKLIVYEPADPTAPTTSGKGSAQDPKKTAPNPCDDDPAVLPTERTAVFPVDEGSDVTLPCSLSSEDLTNKKFVWKKDGRQVFLYDKGTVNSQPQDKQLKGRVVHLPDKLKSGDASITIRNTRVFDSGEYTCEFPDLQPRQIFYVKLLDVVPTAVTAPGNRSAQDRKKTDGRDVEAGLPLMTADTPL